MCAVKLKLESARTEETLKFHFDAWLSRQREDGALMRELPAARPQRDTLPSMIHRLLSSYTCLHLSSRFILIITTSICSQRADESLGNPPTK